MDALAKQKSCELHVHYGGCLTAEDVLELARDVYRDVDWGLYVESYEKAYGERVDVVEMIGKALGGGEAEVEGLAKHYVVGEADAGDFVKFLAKFNLPIALYRHYAVNLDKEEWVQRWILRRVTDRHRSEGIEYIEYRAYYGRCSASENPQ